MRSNIFITDMTQKAKELLHLRSNILHNIKTMDIHTLKVISITRPFKGITVNLYSSWNIIFSVIVVIVVFVTMILIGYGFTPTTNLTKSTSSSDMINTNPIYFDDEDIPKKSSIIQLSRFSPLKKCTIIAAMPMLQHINNSDIHYSIISNNYLENENEDYF